MTKKYVIDEEYIPAHELSLKMLKKYPILKPYYDGGLIFLDSCLKDQGWTAEDFIVGLRIETKDVPWLEHWNSNDSLQVYQASCVCGSAVPKGELYVYRNEVKLKELPHPYCSSDDMVQEEKNIDEFMELIEKAKLLKKQAQTKLKIKEIKKDFK